MGFTEQMLSRMREYTALQTAQELEELIQKEALEKFQITLEILTNQDAHSEDEVLTAMVVNTALNF